MRGWCGREHSRRITVFRSVSGLLLCPRHRRPRTTKPGVEREGEGREGSVEGEEEEEGRVQGEREEKGMERRGEGWRRMLEERKWMGSKEGSG